MLLFKSFVRLVKASLICFNVSTMLLAAPATATRALSKEGSRFNVSHEFQKSSITALSPLPDGSFKIFWMAVILAFWISQEPSN
ncbi:hypothetical protein D1872_283130 [compost metagenome]